MSTAAGEEEPQAKREKREDASSTSSSTVTAPIAATEGDEEDDTKATKNVPEMKEKVAQLTNVDSRVGWPKTRPPFDIMVHGWFFTSHEEVLLSLLDREKTSFIIELGTWLGKSACYFCQNAPNAVVFCVDLWDNSVIEHDSHYAAVNNKDILRRGSIYDQCLSNLWKHKYDGSKGIIPMKMDGCEALHKLKEIGVMPDLIYIDASHHYDGVIRDLSTAIDLFPAAHIVGDDWEYPDVQRATIDCARKFGLSIYVEDNKCWTYSKAICEKVIPERKKMRIEAKKMAEKNREEAASNDKLSLKELLAKKRKASNI